MVANLVTATLQNNNSQPRDEVRFSWVIDNGPIAAPAAQNIFTDFFGLSPGGSSAPMCEALASCMAPSVAPPGAEIRVYDISGHLDGSPHGSPYLVTNARLPSVGGDSRGNQLAVVMGYQAADYLSVPVEGPSGAIKTQGPLAVRTALPTHTGVTKLQSRHSGRLYFGPIDASIIGVNADANPELTGTWQTNFALDVEAFQDVHPEWCIWSRANAAIVRITQGWVDFSIESRRKRAFTGAGRGAWT